MIDLHCHLLPGIDDGPKTLAQSLAMARQAFANGIARCVVTPHIEPDRYDNDCDTIRPVYETFRQALVDEGIALVVGMAAEVRVDAHLPGLIERKKIPFIGHWEGRCAMLMEFPHDHLPPGSEAMVRWLLNRGILPVIAHPERNRAIQREPEKLEPFREFGCLLQITAGSLVGLFGTEARQCAVLLVEQKIVTFMASDAHNLEKRSPDLRPGLDCLVALMGKDQADCLVNANPQKLLQDAMP